MPSQNWFYSFERSPTPSFIAAIRRVFPDFEPCDAHWDRLGKTIEFKTGKAVGEVRWMLPEHVEIALDLFFPVAAAAKPSEKPKSTASKRDELDAFRIRLASRLAEQKGIDELNAITLVDAMKPTEFKDALEQEFNYTSLCVKTVARWRDKRAKESLRPRVSPTASSKARVDGGRQREETAIEAADALPAGITARSRINGITREKITAATAETPEQRQAGRDAAAILRRHKGAKCSCGDDAARFWEGKPKCDDCYAELAAAAAVGS